MKEPTQADFLSPGNVSLSFVNNDFSSLTGKSPGALYVGEDAYPLRTWRDVLSATYDAIAKVDEERLRALVSERIVSLVSTDVNLLRQPRRHEATGLYFELNASAINLLGASRRLFMACGFDLAKIRVTSRGSDVIPASGETDVAQPATEEAVGEMKSHSFLNGDFAMLTGAHPVSLSVGNEIHPLRRWRDVLAATCDAIAKVDVDRLRSAALSDYKNFFADNAAALRRPRRHEVSGLFFETNADAVHITRQSRKLFQACGFDLGTIRLTYQRRDSVLDDVETERDPHSARVAILENKARAAVRSVARLARDLREARMKAREAVRAYWVSLENQGVPFVQAYTETMSKQSSEEMELLKELILKNYPEGVVLNNATVAILEKVAGKHFNEEEVSRVRLDMYIREDGTMLFPEMVMETEVQERMTALAKEFLTQDGMFAYGCLRQEFDGEIRHLPGEKEFTKFFDYFLGREVGAAFHSHGRLGKMMCFGKGVDGPKVLGEKVRDVLRECGDAVSITDFVTMLPYLTRDVIEYTGQNILDDVIVFDIDGERYLKLLDAYYLPDDFSDALSDFVVSTEAQQGVVSIVLLEAEFESRYGEGFRVNYALEDESVFKQVVLRSFRGEEHCWRGDVFTATGIKVSRNVVDEFVKIRKGVFHEEEFFDFALEKRGLGNHASLVCQYLRTRCIRLNRTMWISVEDFRARGILDANLREQVRALLKEQLGTSALLHIGLIPQMAFTAIPPMIIDGKEYAWNTYSLTSVAKHMINGLNIVNDEPSPYYVTAILLPDGVKIKNDGIVEHVFDICKESGLIPSSADKAFDYLKDKLVRMVKTQKLMSKINSYWRF